MTNLGLDGQAAGALPPAHRARTGGHRGGQQSILTTARARARTHARSHCATPTPTPSERQTVPISGCLQACRMYHGPRRARHQRGMCGVEWGEASEAEASKARHEGASKAPQVSTSAAAVQKTCHRRRREHKERERKYGHTRQTARGPNSELQLQLDRGDGDGAQSQRGVHHGPLLLLLLNPFIVPLGPSPMSDTIQTKSAVRTGKTRCQCEQWSWGTCGYPQGGS